MIKLTLPNWYEEIGVHFDLTTSNTRLGRHNKHVESKFQVQSARISNSPGNIQNVLSESGLVSQTKSSCRRLI